MARRAKSDEICTARLRAADPFELIRWLARSQTDPRKALAELVQNSLDGDAHRLTVTRLRERGVAGLRIIDDGRWEVNSGHRDFAAASASAKRKLRHLAALLAKEVVLDSFPVPQGGPVLERLVSVLAMAEPRLERG